MRFVGWLLAFVLALGASGFMLFSNSDALEQSAAVTNGTAKTVSARLEAQLDQNERYRSGKPDLKNPRWWARFETDNPHLDLNRGPAFEVPGKGEILHEWDGATVTCYLWTDGTVIAIKVPDGTLLKNETIGWRGELSKWTSGFFFLGAALLIGGAKLRLGFVTGFVGAVVIAAVLFVVLHVVWLWLGLAVDALLVVALVWWIVGRMRGTKGSE
jgi:hypothetical protein